MANKLQPEDSALRLNGVGAKTLENLHSLGLYKVADFWFHLPYRYQDKTTYYKLADLSVGKYFLSKAQIIKTEIKFGKRRSLLIWLEDTTSLICLRFFYFSQAQYNMYQAGEWLEFYGEARAGLQSIEMIHPEVNLLKNNSKTLQSSNLTPVYNVVKGVTQPTIRKLIIQSLETLDEVPQLLPEYMLHDYGFESLKECLLAAHMPTIDNFDLVEKSRQYLVFEELIAYYFGLKKIKYKRELEESIMIASSGVLRSKCIDNLDFSLTNAQVRVTEEITFDLTRKFPMQRLLQGDVGSGKTLVAVMAALDCVESGFQVAIMVPTELLANQHFLSIQSIVANLGVNCGLLTSSVKDKKHIEKYLADGTIDIAIGTHALFQKSIKFKNLALVIIDEQHRFGVEQRAAMMSKAVTTPHQLIMTATPIPRTLAMSFYSFLDYSVIDELPPGRTDILTSVVSENKREMVASKLNEFVAEGNQAYWVCTLIDESEVLQSQTAADTEEYLVELLPNARVGMIHGQMKFAEKQKLMQDFKNHVLDVLVATTVIEVGVDVPNASLIVIDNSERLGLSQLHQLRGRVGRGSVKSSCVLLYKPPLSNNSKARLQAMRNTNNGFKIAEIDLEIRGPGELLGKQQTGEVKFKLADFSKDKLIIAKINLLKSQLDQQCSIECITGLIKRWQINTDNIV